jgi:glycoprotein 2-beta-D-xylosyltransferase
MQQLQYNLSYHNQAKRTSVYSGRVVLILIILTAIGVSLLWNILLFSLGTCIPEQHSLANLAAADAPVIMASTFPLPAATNNQNIMPTTTSNSTVIKPSTSSVAIPVAAAVAAIPVAPDHAPVSPLLSTVLSPTDLVRGSSPAELYLARHRFWSQPVKQPSVQLCSAQFGNNFNTVLNLCKNSPNNNTNNNNNHDNNGNGAEKTSEFICYHNPSLRATNCDIRNFALDLSLISSVAKGGESIESVRFQKEDNEYLGYKPGAVLLNCQKNADATSSLDSKQKELKEQYFPNHLEHFVRNSQFSAPISCDSWLETPTILVTRYEFANLFHSLTLWYNIFQAQHLFNMHETAENSTIYTEIDVIFLDAHSASALDPIWTNLFHSVRYLRHFEARKLCFRRALLIAPGYKSAIGVPMMNSKKSNCYNSKFLQDFSNNLLSTFNVPRLKWAGNEKNKLIFAENAISPDGAPKADEILEIIDTEGTTHQITLNPDTKLAIYIARRDYIAHPRSPATKSVQRQLANEQQFNALCVQLFSPLNFTFLSLDYAQLPLRSQIILYHYSSFVISLHGAALAHVVSANPNTVTVEMRPASYAGRLTFQYLSQWLNRDYAQFAIPPGKAKEQVLFELDLNLFKQRLQSVINEKLAGKLAPYTEFKSLATPRGLRWPQFNGVNTDLVISNEDELRILAAQVKSAKAYNSSVPNAVPAAARATAPAPQSNGVKVTVLKLDEINNNNNAVRPAAASAAVTQLSQNSANNAVKGSNSAHKLCLIVPFRDSSSRTSQAQNRTENLMGFIPSISDHLHSVGNTNFEILVIEQQDDEILFNKGALFNIGAEMNRQMKHGCDYYILHDVDQLPESKLNTYAYPSSDYPVHLCVATSAKDYRVAYSTMVGGVLAITADQYARVNGYSNEYWGWGQEDDDFFYRLSGVFGKVERLSPAIGRYTALQHDRVKDLDVTSIFRRGTVRLKEMAARKLNIQSEGLNTVKFEKIKSEAVRVDKVMATKYTVSLQFAAMPTSLNDEAFLNAKTS